jgi:hypothetical protein
MGSPMDTVMAANLSFHPLKKTEGIEKRYVYSGFWLAGTPARGGVPRAGMRLLPLAGYVVVGALPHPPTHRVAGKA